MNGIQGLDNLLGTLATLKDRSAKKAAKAGVTAGIKVLAQGMVAAINASGASPELKAAARKTIGKRLKKKEGQGLVGKAGFSVGKRSRRKCETAHERYVRGQGGAHETRGVGVSSSNVHWFVLGTDQRVTGSGHYTGQIDELLQNIVGSAAASAGPAMLEAARQKVEQVLAAEAAKARKG